MAGEQPVEATPSSSGLCSAHIESLRETLETLDLRDEHALAKAEINASKVHWSELASAYFTVEEGEAALDSLSSSSSQVQWVSEAGTLERNLEVAEDNACVFRSLREQYPAGFFIDENDVGPGSLGQQAFWMCHDNANPWAIECRLSSATPFAEGGQAQLFHAHVLNTAHGTEVEGLVMKVFKEGTSVRELLSLFPPSMLSDAETSAEGMFGDSLQNCNAILGGRLLKSSGRFAFLMMRAWGDLRKLIDRRMVLSNNQGPPFRSDVAYYIIHEIAKGMQSLHAKAIIHRDLKAANVLVFGVDVENCIVFDTDPTLLEPHEFRFFVADFECSVGVVGTRFWRAPEILEGVKNRSIYQESKVLFTKYADVYSFGMTCYEILSGGIPFEKLGTNDYDAVIGGARPVLPKETAPWMADLVQRCWHKDPFMRPLFEEIVGRLEPYVDVQRKFVNTR